MKVDGCKQMNTVIQQVLATNFENFTCSKTITQEQASKIKAVINKAKTINQSYFVNAKTLTEQARKIYMDNNDIKYIHFLKELVDNENLTEDQAKKIIMKRVYLCQNKWVLVYFKNLFK